jgi:hypothetical protein
MKSVSFVISFLAKKVPIPVYIFLIKLQGKTLALKSLFERDSKNKKIKILNPVLSSDTRVVQSGSQLKLIRVDREDSGRDSANLYHASNTNN